MSEHTATPTPWQHDKYGNLRGVNGKNVNVWGLGIGHASRDTETQANAEFIVLACNSHNALLEACRNAQRALLRILPQDEMLSIYAEIESAIRLAEGKENASE